MHKVEEIGLIARAEDMQKAFSKLAVDMFNLVIDVDEIDLVQTKTFIIRARDANNLLYQFMKRLFDLANNDLFVLATVKSLTMEKVGNEYLLTTVLIGDKINQNYKVKDIVKQVTDRGIEVKESKGEAIVKINIIVERRKNEI